MKGKLIVIDGTDGSGKATQVNRLMERLSAENISAEQLDFPRYYDNFFGKLIGECLAGEHGDWSAVDPRIASVIYAADRFESRDTIQGWLDAGKMVILDRYVSSNQIHQAGKINDPEQRAEFLSWLDTMEHEVFSLPRPDMIIYLDVSLNQTQRLLSEKNLADKKRYLEGRGDQHENNPEHLENAKQSGLALIAEKNNWQSIVCDPDGEMRTIEDIHEEIFILVQKTLEK